MECFLCQENPSSGENPETHLKTDHGVKHDVDLLLALQVMTKEEKCSLLKQMEGRVIKLKQNVAKNENYDVLEEMSSRDEPVLKVITKVLKVEHNPIPVFSKRVDESVATKIRFWKGKEASPKQAVKEHDGKHFFRRKEGDSNEKALNKLLKQTLSEHLLGQKSADDTIEIFDEIFATTCSYDMDDSVEGTFRLLLDDDLVEEAGCNTPSEHFSSEEEASEDLVVEPRSKKVLQETCKTVITDGKYKCSECGKSFKFLTYLKGHMNSKVGCNHKKKQGPLYIR